MSVLIFDTEATGRGEGRQIIEAAWLRLHSLDDMFDEVGEGDRIRQPLAVAESFCQRYWPSCPLEFGAIAVHHILPEELAGCPPSETFALPQICSYVVGHAIDFDWEAAGRPDVKRICTHAMSTHIWPDADGYSQSALIYMLDGATTATRDRLRTAHSALTDVDNNLRLLQHILDAKPELQTWSALWAFSEEARIPIYSPLKRWDGLKLSEMDDGAIRWCLNQEWIDEYFRKGLERVWAERYPPRPPAPQLATADIGDDDIPF